MVVFVNANLELGAPCEERAEQHPRCPACPLWLCLRLLALLFLPHPAAFGHRLSACGFALPAAPPPRALCLLSVPTLGVPELFKRVFAVALLLRQHGPMACLIFLRLLAIAGEVGGWARRAGGANVLAALGAFLIQLLTSASEVKCSSPSSLVLTSLTSERADRARLRAGGLA